MGFIAWLLCTAAAIVVALVIVLVFAIPSPYDLIVFVVCGLVAGWLSGDLAQIMKGRN